MNESDLENQLRLFKPATPPLTLESRITAAFDALEATQKIRPAVDDESLLAKIVRPLFWASVGAAAAVAVISSGSTVPPASGSLLAGAVAGMTEIATPETTRELLAAEESGIRYEAEHGPVREVRASYLEHHAWTDPRTGGRVKIAIPREDVFLQPIAMQ